MSSLNQPWTSMRGNSRNDGYVRRNSAAQTGRAIRHFTTGNAIFSTPVIGEEDRIFVGSADQSFYAFDTLNNNALWSFATEGIIDSAACMDKQNMLYVPSGDGCLYKLNSDGQEIWRLDILKRRPRTLSTIYWWEGNAAVGPNGWIYAGNDDFCLYAIDSDGQVRWTFASGLQIWSAPAFHNGLVFIASFDMYVYALEEATGKIVWKRRLDNCITSSPAVTHDGNIIIGCFGGTVYALNGKSGKIRWRRPTGGAIYASAAITPDARAVIGSCDGLLYCVHTETGDLLWTYDTHSPVWSSVSVLSDPEQGETLYAGDSNGHIMALRKDGTLLWSYASGFQGEGGRQNDINASIALGTHGLAAASARGEVLYIPYDAYKNPAEEEKKRFLPQTDIQNPIPPAPEPDGAKHSSPSSLLPAVGTELEIRNIVFKEPAIITPLDQIGIVSLSIRISIVRSDPATGRFVAWGVQTFGYSDDGMPVGIPEPRHYFYAFSGSMQGQNMCLQAQNCDFEITAFPIPLDTLSFIATKSGDKWKGTAVHGFLQSQHLMRTLIRRYGTLSLSYVAFQLFRTPLLRGFHLHIASGWRTLRAIRLLFIQRRWKEWGLLDSEGNFASVGTFALVEARPKRRELVFTGATCQTARRKITATFVSHGANRYEDGFPGIVLIDRTSLQALPLSYWKYIRVHYKKDQTVRVTFRIPSSVDLKTEHIDAVVLINCDIQTTLQIS